MPLDIATILKAIGSIVATIGSIYATYYGIKKLKKPNVELVKPVSTELSRTIKIVKNISMQYTDLNKLTSQIPGCERALILKAHDSGSPINPTKMLFTSVVREISSDLDMIANTWQKQPVDNQYTNFLSQILTAKNEVLLITDDLQEGVLRNYYKAYRIQKSVSYFLWINSNKEGEALEIFYLTLEFSDLNLFTHKQKELIRTNLTSVRNLVSETEKLLKS